MENFLLGIKTGLVSIILDIKNFLIECWEYIYSFLSRFLNETVIYLFVGTILLMIIFVVLLKIINHK
ncbi:MAG: hypothetical protein HFH86_02280 [Bacilli bacterium]|nr:hypothetical protein [Bacilli bacterium]